MKIFVALFLAKNILLKPTYSYNGKPFFLVSNGVNGK